MPQNSHIPNYQNVDNYHFPYQNYQKIIHIPPLSHYPPSSNRA